MKIDLEVFKRKRLLRLLFFHSAILLALFFLDEPLAQRYHRFFQDIYRGGEQRIMEYKKEAGDSVSLQLHKDSRTVATENLNIGPRTKVQVRHIRKREKDWAYILVDHLTDRRVWEFFEQFGVVFSALLVCIFIWEYAPDKRRYIIWLIVSLAAAYLTVWLVQHTVGKIRPSRCGYEVTFLPFPSGWEEDSSLSFPSGHTTFAFVVATFLAGLYPRMHWFFYSIAALTGLSRVVHEAHWISDVYGGMLTGYGATSLIKIHYFSIENAIYKRLPARMKRGFRPENHADLKEGNPCPDFNTVTIEGRPISSGLNENRDCTLVFVPCGTAPATINRLQKLDMAIKNGTDTNIPIIITPDPEYLLAAIKKKHNLSLDFLSDRKRTISRSFKLLAIGRRRPRETTVIISNQGIIKTIHPGFPNH